MAKKTGTETGAENLEPVVEPEPEVVSEPTLTETEQLEALQAQLKEKDEKLQGVEGRYKGLQTKYNKMYEQSKPGFQPSYQPSGDDTLLEMMLQDRRAKAGELGESDPMIPRLEAELSTRKQRQTQQVAFARQQGIASEAREKLNRKIEEAGFDPSDDAFLEVDESFDYTNAFDGKFERVDRKLDRILKSLKPEKKESEAEADEKLRKEMEKRGMLTSETGIPSASGKRSFTTAQIEALPQYPPGSEEYKAQLKALNEAYRGGRITE